MIPYDLDPSLHSGEPQPQLLEDGFSPPNQGHRDSESDSGLEEAADSFHWAKSEF